MSEVKDGTRGLYVNTRLHEQTCTIPSIVLPMLPAKAAHRWPVAETGQATVVPVRLHAGNFDFLSAKPDGADLRVVAADDKTPLKFHVEKCVPEGIEQGEPERSKSLAELVDIFDRYVEPEED